MSVPRSHNAGDHADARSDRLIAMIEIGPTTWRVRSCCGVVHVYSSRDGCMAAMNSQEALRVARDFTDALMAAALSVDSASRGNTR